MDSSRVLDVLALARALVEAGWSQGYVARNARGDTCLPPADAAVSFCAAGAVERACLELDMLCYGGERYWAEHLLDILSVEGDIAIFNDRPATTQADVLALFDQAAARVGKS